SRASRASTRQAARAASGAQDFRGPATSLARVEHAVVEPHGTAFPELDSPRLNPEAAPEARPRHLLRQTPVKLREPGRELPASPGKLGALAGSPGADLRVAGAARPVLVRLGVGYGPGRAFDAHLFRERGPPEAERGRSALAAAAQKLRPLSAPEVGVEDESPVIHGADQHHADGRFSVGTDRRERGRVGFQNIRTSGERRPFPKQRDRIGRLGHRLGTVLPDFPSRWTGRYFTPRRSKRNISTSAFCWSRSESAVPPPCPEP